MPSLCGYMRWTINASIHSRKVYEVHLVVTKSMVGVSSRTVEVRNERPGASLGSWKDMQRNQYTGRFLAWFDSWVDREIEHLSVKQMSFGRLPLVLMWSPEKHCVSCVHVTQRVWWPWARSIKMMHWQFFFCKKKKKKKPWGLMIEVMWSSRIEFSTPVDCQISLLHLLCS